MDGANNCQSMAERKAAALGQRQQQGTLIIGGTEVKKKIKKLC